MPCLPGMKQLVRGRSAQYVEDTFDFDYVKVELTPSCELLPEVKTQLTPSMLSEELLRLANLPRPDTFKNVSAWLQTQDRMSYLDREAHHDRVACGCCEPTDEHYACVDVTRRLITFSPRPSFNDDISHHARSASYGSSHDASPNSIYNCTYQAGNLQDRANANHRTMASNIKPSNESVNHSRSTSFSQLKSANPPTFINHTRSASINPLMSTPTSQSQSTRMTSFHPSTPINNSRSTSSSQLMSFNPSTSINNSKSTSSSQLMSQSSINHSRTTSFNPSPTINHSRSTSMESDNTEYIYLDFEASPTNFDTWQVTRKPVRSPLRRTAIVC